MRKDPQWTTPDELLSQLLRSWERGMLLRGEVPPLRLRKPTSRELGERFGEVQDWIRALEEGSHRLGYQVEYEEIAHRQLGKNRVPVGVSISMEAGLRALRKNREAERYQVVVREVCAEFPELKDWLARRPLAALDVDWERTLAVLRYFRRHPRCGLYRRQLEISGIDTKFIEENRGRLGELLTLVLPQDQVIDEPGVSFDRRFGLREKPSLVRFRILDESLHIQGLSDLTVPVEELAQLDLPVEEIIVTENEVNGLALPPRPRTLVVFGRGYALDHLGGVPWLAKRRLRYWGDIDTHGFGILDRFRAYFPDAESLMMDAETFHAHRTMWVEECTPRSDPLLRLSPPESALYAELIQDAHGERLRLEQERIPFAWVRRQLGHAEVVVSDRERELHS